MTTVAFQGEPGAYSAEAVYQHFGNQVQTLPCPAFENLFDA
ncbi:MAG: bifunctional chorismate mutase/prephenate dehydratase, partial [Chloroflexi bacterium]|nr:bifunctional chorismate mutase/prephenate dehydratase [Chloroflexota bacterium]